jgi:glycosyltransferase involved in cell wall biosynthesis
MTRLRYGVVQCRGRLLIVSYYFPPAAGVASTRVAKLAKYLARLGWQVRAMTAPPPETTDASLVRDTGDVEVIAIEGLRPLPTLHGIAWTTALLPRLWREAEAADVILVSGAPFLPFLAAALVGRRAPYVLDARDLWADEPRFGRDTRVAKRRAVQRLERIAEATSMKRAAAVVTVAPELADLFAGAHPNLGAQIEVIPHGFDPDDFALGHPAVVDTPTLLHAGTMMAGERTPELIIESARLVRSAGIPLHVQLLGRFDERLQDMAEAPRAEGWLSVEPPVDHAAAVAAIENASALWLEPGPYDFAVTGKVYEYLASGRPIVVAADIANAAARVVTRAGGGIVAGDGAASCASAVQAALLGDVPARNAAVMDGFSMPRIAERLDAILQAVAR